MNRAGWAVCAVSATALAAAGASAIDARADQRTRPAAPQLATPVSRALPLSPPPAEDCVRLGFRPTPDYGGRA